MTPQALVPLIAVTNIRRSIEFYRKLGFVERNAYTPEGASEPAWASITSGSAELMLGRADEPVDAGTQGVLFYVYLADVPASREALIAEGVTAGPITYPFYAPRGEFRVTDPDGYVLMITHTDTRADEGAG